MYSRSAESLSIAVASFGSATKRFMASARSFDAVFALAVKYARVISFCMGGN
jgi:hypothetical protein